MKIIHEICGDPILSRLWAAAHVCPCLDPALTILRFVVDLTRRTSCATSCNAKMLWNWCTFFIFCADFTVDVRYVVG